MGRVEAALHCRRRRRLSSCSQADGQRGSNAGIVKYSVGLPDCHSGYGFAIGNVAAFDMDDPEAVVSPGGVGFDINCGVRLIRTNLTEKDVVPVQEELAQLLFNHIPVGVGSRELFQPRHRISRELLRWAWTGVSGRALAGVKTESTVRRTGACWTQIPVP